MLILIRSHTRNVPLKTSFLDQKISQASWKVIFSISNVLKLEEEEKGWKEENERGTRCLCTQCVSGQLSAIVVSRGQVDRSRLSKKRVRDV